MPGCDRVCKGHGLCEMHYDRWRAHGDPNYTRPTEEERFWSKVDVRAPDECWPWSSALNEHGYGVFGGRKLPVLAHRAMWQVFNGPIPAGMCVLHHCDNPRCVNPAHLWLGTNADNTADMMTKGRHKPVSLPGERNPNVRITADDVACIRALYAAGGISQDRLARQFGISQTQTSRVIRGESWSR